MRVCPFRSRSGLQNGIFWKGSDERRGSRSGYRISWVLLWQFVKFLWENPIERETLGLWHSVEFWMVFHSHRFCRRIDIRPKCVHQNKYNSSFLTPLFCTTLNTGTVIWIHDTRGITKILSFCLFIMTDKVRTRREEGFESPISRTRLFLPPVFTQQITLVTYFTNCWHVLDLCSGQ